MIVTISRQAEPNGGLIGRLVAERLGLRVYDRELVDEIARRLHVDPDIVTPFDEATLNPVQSVLWEWRTSVNEQVYARYLRKALKHIHAEGNAVIIGRGANFVLHCPHCLHVRIVAPTPLRVAIYRAYFDVSEDEALHRIREEDKAKARFARAIFHESIDDPLHYDLVINLGGVGPETAVDLIARAAEERTRQHLPLEPHSTLPQHVEIMARHRRPIRPEIIERYRRIP
jgi:cytidylate kinase